MVQRVRYKVLSLHWLESLLWLGFGPWHRNDHILQEWPKKKPQLNMCDRLTHPMHTVHTPGIPPLTILHSYTHTLHTFIPNTHATCIYISQTWAPYVPDQTNHTNCIYQAHTPNMHPKYTSWGKKMHLDMYTYTQTHTHSLSNFTLNLIDGIFSFKRQRASFFVFCFPFYSHTGRGMGKFPG